MNEETKIN